jgi:O-antigen/teichoic acid export membrane protein
VGLLVGVLGGLRSAESLIFVLAASFALTALLAVASLGADRRRLMVNEILPTDATILPSLWRAARPLYVVELVQVSIASLPVMILGVFADANAVSVFSVALRASMLVWVVLLSLSTVASPRFAALHRQGRNAELATINRQIQLAGAVMGGGICAVLGLAARPLLSLIGPGFVAGAPVLVVLALGQAVNALYSGQDTLMAMTGRGNVLKYLNLAQLAVMLAFSILLIPPFGAMGAAIATAITTAQGALGAAMAVTLLIPDSRPWLPLPAPSLLRRLFLSAVP